MKQIDLGPDEYRDVESEVRERSDAIKAAKPDYPTPPPKPVMPDIKWVKPEIINGKAIYRGRK
jgi:hypothetical protein